MIRERYNRRQVEVNAVTDLPTAIISLADAKAFLRVDGTADDALITMLIGVAVDSAEKYLRRSILTKSLILTMDGFPFSDDDALVRLGSGTHQVPPTWITGGYDEFDLPYPPVASVTSITTFNPANVGSVFSASAYIVDNARVVLNQGFTWPLDLRDRAAVKVEYVAGYGAANLPSSIKLGMMQHLVAMYECRTGCDMPDAARGLMDQYRILDGLAW